MSVLDIRNIVVTMPPGEQNKIEMLIFMKVELDWSIPYFLLPSFLSILLLCCYISLSPHPFFSYCIIYYTELHYTTLHYTTLYHTTIHYTTYTTLHHTVPYYTTLHCTALHYTTPHLTILYDLSTPQDASTSRKCSPLFSLCLFEYHPQITFWTKVKWMNVWRRF